MPHELSLITTLAAGFGLAMILGFIAVRLKMPPLVGYMLAGIVIGPNTRGFVGDVTLAAQLADVGVMLLLFGVGLHFSLKDLSEVRGIAVPGALIQIPVVAVLGLVTARLWGWGIGAGIVFGLCLSVASTVVLLRALEDRGLLSSFNGNVALGWLIVQDVAMVLVLVLLPPLATLLGGKATSPASGDLTTTLVLTFLKVAAFIILMVVVGKRLFPRILWTVAKTGSRELFTLCVVSAAICVAYGSARFFGVSFALGAFFAGMMMRESALSHRAATDSLPLQDAFAVLFFVSVGMLFDPAILVRMPIEVLVTTAIIMLANPTVAILTVVAMRYPFDMALTIGAGLAQIGEFSFILGSLGLSLGLLSSEGYNLVLAGALISIALNPLMFRSIAPFQRWAAGHSRAVRKFRRSIDPLSELPMTVDQALLTGHVVLVGYGRVGRRVAEALSRENIAFVVVEQNRGRVEELRKMNIPAVSGDASTPEALIQGHVARARMLVIAIPDTLHTRRMVEIARMLNPPIEIALRTHSEEEAELFRNEQLGKVFMGEHELALGIIRFVLSHMRPTASSP